MTDVGTTPRRPMTGLQRLRIFENHGGICCLCDTKIKVGERWIIEHPRALGLGGSDTDDNKAPAHESCRRIKDKVDVANIARAKRRKAKHLGIRKPSAFKKPRGWRHNWKTGRLEKEPT